MKKVKFSWNASLSHTSMRVSVCVGLAIMVVLVSGAVDWKLIGSYATRAHASGIMTTATSSQPWGEALDGAGHIWVAEPGCDASPICGRGVPPNGPGAGVIGEYDATTLNKIKDFTAPASTPGSPWLRSCQSSRANWG